MCKSNEFHFIWREWKACIYTVTYKRADTLNAQVPIYIAVTLGLFIIINETNLSNKLITKITHSLAHGLYTSNISLSLSLFKCSNLVFVQYNQCVVYFLWLLLSSTTNQQANRQASKQESQRTCWKMVIAMKVTSNLQCNQCKRTN